MNKPQMIFFDAAGTLIHLPRGVGAHYREVAQRHGLELREERLTGAFRRAWKEAVPPAVTRSARPDDDRGWWQSLVYRVLELCEVTGRFEREAYFRELYDEFTKPGVWELYPEAREVLEYLSGRYRLGVVSNFDGRLRRILEHLGLSGVFEVVVISSEVGADKPDEWIFRRALELAGVRAEAALHVGDDPECDWQAAKALGLRSFELERPRVTLRDLLVQLGG